MTEMEISASFLLLSNILQFVPALIGALINSYLFYKFFKKGVRSGFYKLCLLKTIPNFLVCAGFLFWAVPLGFLQIRSERIPRIMNVLVAQVCGSFSYVLGPLLLTSMALNRFVALYFPVFKSSNSKLPVTSIWITVCIITAACYAVAGLPEDCGYMFLPEEMLWISEEGKCSEIEYDILLYFVFVAGISNTDAKLRRRTYIKRLSQCFIQDSLHSIDSINTTYTYKLDESSLWFQFICFSLSFVVMHMLDGFVMFFFHTAVQPMWLRKQSSVKIMVSAARIT
ncbi:Protein CBG10916 [Caenorhabditis briggsae]|uniref:Protein CBG10916 n=1 Tax=Caenorhabditis briggsae TaxID=6238 RepID=A8XC96_CAEBR|nr:Protein CBG10916 [Caenorhabditis briggsae]CAP30194.2 Protein CBG10916 [Caenorhabditis briggsae]